MGVRAYEAHPCAIAEARIELATGRPDYPVSLSAQQNGPAEARPRYTGFMETEVLIHMSSPITVPVKFKTVPFFYKFGTGMIYVVLPEADNIKWEVTNVVLTRLEP